EAAMSSTPIAHDPLRPCAVGATPLLGAVEASSQGKWQTVPALHVGDCAVVVKSGWLRQAIVHDEEWLETALADPRACLDGLKTREGRALKADVFTFAQRVPDTTPRLPHYSELESIAVCHVTTFKAWWEALPQESRKNVRRAEKRGVTVSLRELDDDLVRGI